MSTIIPIILHIASIGSLMLSTSAFAMSVEDARQRATHITQDQAQAMSQRVEQADVTSMPGYQEAAQARLLDNQALEQATPTAANTSPAAQLLYQRAEQPDHGISPTQRAALQATDNAVVEQAQANATVSGECVSMAQSSNQHLDIQTMLDCQSRAQRIQSRPVNSAASIGVSQDAVPSIDAVTSQFSVFGGTAQRCTVEIFGIDNCCSATRSAFTVCSEEEDKLVVSREQEYTHYVGSHCSRRRLGVCLRRTHTYCTFTSKLSRIVMQQAMGQLNQSFGDSATTQCDGLTPSQMAQVDMSQFDLSEYHQDVSEHIYAPSTFNQERIVDHALESLVQSRSPQ